MVIKMLYLNKKIIDLNCFNQTKHFKIKQFKFHIFNLLEIGKFY